jgi:hypothetical protein
MQIFEKLKPLALLLLRVGVGGIFLYEGYLKLFVSPAKWLAWFPQHGFPSYFAYLAGGMEFFGGFLLIVGLVTRVAGLFLGGNGNRGLEGEPATLGPPQRGRLRAAVDAGAGVVHAGGGRRGTDVRGRRHV